MKMQISFYFEKVVMISRFLKLKKKIMTTKTSRTCFNKNILAVHDMNI